MIPLSKNKQCQVHASPTTTTTKEDTMHVLGRTSCTSILVCDGPDGTVEATCAKILKDKTPIIIPSCALEGTLRKLPTEQLSDTDWRVYHSANKSAFLWMPNTEKDPSVSSLDRYGYDASKLFSTSPSKVQTVIRALKSLPGEDYLEQYAETLPDLYLNNEVKKRFNFIGHGLSVTKCTPSTTARFCGFTTKQMIRVLEKLTVKGMDYCNFIACFGGKNFLTVFGTKPRSFTASVFSVGDFPVAMLSDEGCSFFFNSQPSTALFWNQINKIFATKISEKTKEKTFAPALEALYGHDLSGLPIVSIKGKPFFKAVDLGNRSKTIDYDGLLGHDIIPAQVKEIPFVSIASRWAQSTSMQDRLNHCSQQIAFCERALCIANKGSDEHTHLNHMLSYYQQLKSQYLLIKSVEAIDPLCDELYKNIVSEEYALENSPFFHSHEDHPFSTREACLLIYPQIIKAPICLQRTPQQRTFPIILSKIPGDSHLLLASVWTTEGTPEEVICQALFPQNSEFKYTSTTRVVVIRELSVSPNKEKAYNNVVAVASENSAHFLFQKRNDTRWYCTKNVRSTPETVEVCPYEARLELYRLSRDISPSKEAYSMARGGTPIPALTKDEVVECYRDWFGIFAAQENSFIAALESIDVGDVSTLSTLAAGLDAPACRVLALRAVQKNNISSLLALKDRMTDLNKAFMNENTLLTEACHAAEFEMIQTLLQLGCKTVDSSSMQSIIAQGKDRVLKLLCDNGAPLESLLSWCVEERQPSCLTIALNTGASDFSMAFQLAIQSNQLNAALELVEVHGTKISCSALIIDTIKSLPIYSELERRGVFKKINVTGSVVVFCGIKFDMS